MLLTLIGLITQSSRDLVWVDSPRRYSPRWAIMDSSQLQHLSTCRDHVLDLFCSNKPGLVKSVSVIRGFSDHGFVVVATALKLLLSKKTPRKWNPADRASIRQSTMDFAKNAIQSGLGVDELYTSFMDHVKSLERFIPATCSWVRTDVPWLTRDLKQQCNKNIACTTEWGRPTHHHTGQTTMKLHALPRRPSVLLTGGMWIRTRDEFKAILEVYKITASRQQWGSSIKTQRETSLRFFIKSLHSTKTVFLHLHTG